MLKLIASGKHTIESVMNQAGRAVVELLLQLSAPSIAGEKSTDVKTQSCSGTVVKADRFAYWRGGSK